MSKKPDLSADDRFALQDLLARYAWALDTGDIDTLVSCFLPDGVVVEEVFEEPDRWEGHAGVRELGRHYAASTGFPGRQHHISQSIIEGDSRAVHIKSFAFVTECCGEPPYTLRFTGYYEDRVEKHAGEWLFRERIIRLWDGAVLRNFPGRGEWVPRKRPPELKINRKGTP